MKHSEGWTKSQDDNRLYWQRWQPKDEARAVLIYVHGLSEHSGRYTHVMRHFAERGFDSWAVDYRGHGQSPGRRVHVQRFDDYLLDLAAVYRLMRREQTWLPCFFVGHSQGGLLTLRYALTRSEGLAGIVISSPFLKLHADSAPPAPLHMVANILSTFTPTLMFSKVAKPELLSRDPDVGKAYQDDPLVSSEVSARWFASILQAQADTRRRPSELSLPALIMQSGDDRLVDPAATRKWAEAAPPELVEYEEWDGFYHEMFNEHGKEMVFARMEKWFDARLAELAD